MSWVAVASRISLDAANQGIFKALVGAALQVKFTVTKKIER
jgi:hypothetical protein